MTEEIRRERLEKVLAACKRDWRWARVNQRQGLVRKSAKVSGMNAYAGALALIEDDCKRERIEIMRSVAVKLRARGDFA
jgi:hypothetical protein